MKNNRIGQSIEEAAEALRKGELVGIPTETVYGLAANAYNVEAVSKIFEAKNRPTFDPLIVHTHHPKTFNHLVQEVPQKLLVLAEAYMPGALTLLLPKKDIIPDLVTAGSPRVAIRIPDHALTLALLASLDFPLAAPSANPFGYISPTQASHVAAQLGDKVSYLLDGGTCSVGIESTIVGLDEENEITVYRLGGISIEAIESIVGKVKMRAHALPSPEAAGMLENHYAPHKKMYLTKLVDFSPKANERVGAISFCKPYEQFAFCEVLSPTCDFKQAAQNLFQTMRYLDSLALDYIVAELLPEEGLGRAINDRLRKAATK